MGNEAMNCAPVLPPLMPQVPYLAFVFAQCWLLLGCRMDFGQQVVKWFYKMVLKSIPLEGGWVLVWRDKLPQFTQRDIRLAAESAMKKSEGNNAGARIFLRCGICVSWVQVVQQVVCYICKSTFCKGCCGI